MEFCKYKKDLNFSYTMGAFPTIELLQSKNYKIISVLVHSKYDDKAGLEKICDEKGINLIYNDKIVNKLQNKENTFVIGVFEKNFAKIKKTFQLEPFFSNILKRTKINHNFPTESTYL